MGLNRATHYPQSLIARALGSVKEAFISAGIYVAFATPIDLGFALFRMGGSRQLYENIGIPETLGRISEQLTLLVISLSIVAYQRRRSGTHKFILLDWRCWVIALVLIVLPTKPIVNWLGTGLIYQYRESRKCAVQTSTDSGMDDPV